MEVTTDPNTHVDLLDKDGNIIGSGTTDDTGHVTITYTNLFLKVMSLLYDGRWQNIRIVLHLNRKATDTTPPTAPVVTSDLTGKATTTDPVEVTTDPNTKVELLDKDGNVIGSGTTDDTGHVTITPTRPIPVVMSLRKLMTMRKFLMLRLLNRRKQLIRHSDNTDIRY